MQLECKCWPQANVNTQKEGQTIDKFLSSTKINSSRENAFSPFTFQFVKYSNSESVHCDVKISLNFHNHVDIFSRAHFVIVTKKDMQQLRHDDDDDVALTNDEIIQHGAAAVAISKSEFLDFYFQFLYYGNIPCCLHLHF